MTRFIAQFSRLPREPTEDVLVGLSATPGGVSVLPRNQIAYLRLSPIPADRFRAATMPSPARPALQQITDSLGVPLVDLTGPLRDYRPQPVYYPNQWHWNAAGDRAAATGILAALSRQGLIASRCAP